MPDAYLDANAIRAETFIRYVELHDTLDSTNNRAIELARGAILELPALIAARRQTAGRGRGKNTWWSADGALTFSVLLEPASLGINTANWPLLSLATAVAVCDAIAVELNPQSPPARLAIKWPNDIMLNDAKLCGILTESPGGPAPAKNRLIIGIGINANNPFCDPPPAARGLAPPISLSDATGHTHNLQQILCNVLNAIHNRITQLVHNDPQLFTTLQSLCWLTGKTVEVSQDHAPQVKGQCLGIDHNGALLIEDSFRTHQVCSGSVHVL